MCAAAQIICLDTLYTVGNPFAPGEHNNYWLMVIIAASALIVLICHLAEKTGESDTDMCWIRTGENYEQGKVDGFKLLAFYAPIMIYIVLSVKIMRHTTARLRESPATQMLTHTAFMTHGKAYAYAWTYFWIIMIIVQGAHYTSCNPFATVFLSYQHMIDLLGACWSAANRRHR